MERFPTTLEVNIALERKLLRADRIACRYQQDELDLSSDDMSVNSRNGIKLRRTLKRILLKNLALYKERQQQLDEQGLDALKAEVYWSHRRESTPY